jgi:hypothetical protein
MFLEEAFTGKEFSGANFDEFAGKLGDSGKNFVKNFLGAGEEGLTNTLNLVGSTLGAQKQTSINKGFGQKTLAYALQEIGAGVPGSTAGKIQNTMSEALFAMSMSVTSENKDAVLDKYVPRLAQQVQDYALEGVNNPQAASVAEYFNLSDSHVDAVRTRAASITSAENLGEMKKSLVKTLHPIIKTQQNLIDSARTMTSAQVLETAQGFGEVMEAASSASHTSAGVRDGSSYGARVSQLAKSGHLPGNISPNEVPGMLQQADFNTRETSLAKQLFGLDTLESSVGVTPQTGTMGQSSVDQLIKENEVKKARAQATNATPSSSLASEAKGITGAFGDFFRHMATTDDLMGKKSHELASNIVNKSFDFVGNHKGAFALAGAGLAVAATAHISGYVNGGDIEIDSAPLPPTTPLDDGAMLPSAEFDISGGGPSVQVASELPGINSTNVTYAGDSMSPGTIGDLLSTDLSSTFIHDDRSSFDRQSMMQYKNEQRRSRF